MIKKDNTVQLFLTITLTLFLTAILSGCGGSTDESNVEKVNPAPVTSSQSETKAKTTNKGSTSVSGWKKSSYDKYDFFLPKEWKDGGTDGAWCPGDQDTTAGLPKVSLHVGSMPPLMSGSTIEEKLKFYYHAVPTTISEIDKCGPVRGWI